MKKTKKLLFKETVSSQKGQVVLEYVLLTMVAITVAIIITTKTIKRDKEDPGFIVLQWHKILESIGKDLSSEP